MSQLNFSHQIHAEPLPVADGHDEAESDWEGPDLEVAHPATGEIRRVVVGGGEGRGGGGGGGGRGPRARPCRPDCAWSHGADQGASSPSGTTAPRSGCPSGQS